MCRTALICLTLCLTLFSHAACAEDTSKKPAKKSSLKALVADLNHDNYQRRVNAVKKLVAAGRPAIVPVTKVAIDGGFEESARAMLVLGTLLESPDTATANEVELALRKVAASKNTAAKKTAAYYLRGPNRLRVMGTLAAEIKLSRVVGEKVQLVPLVKTARYRFSDPSRTHLDGSFWIWADGGRPAAFSELWTNRGTETNWYFGLVSVSQQPLFAEIGQGPPWRPEKTVAEFIRFTKAPEPAADAKKRLKQIMGLAGRFKAHEIGDPKLKEQPLKVLEKPVYRYSDKSSAVVDGAVFLVCHAGNPEVAMLIEAVKPKTGPAVWQYALLRVSSAELHVQLDEKEVWMRPGANPIAGKPNAPYRIRFRAVAANN